MYKIAVISDIHGNLEALKTVLNDIEKRNVDKIVCLGDIVAKGRHFHECIALLQEKCDVVVKGNCDWFFTEFEDAPEEINRKRLKYNRDNLTEEDINYLKSLPLCYEIKLSGSLIRMFHSNPKDICAFVGDQSSLDEYYDMFLPTENTISKDIADIVLYGHIHKAFMIKLYNRTLINVGSVGNCFEVYKNKYKDADPRNITKANYVIISGNIDSNSYDSLSYEFVELKYDIEKELSNSKDAFEYEELSKELREARYRDIQSLKVKLSKLNIDIDEM